MEENIFYLQSQQLSLWKFGCKEYREWAKKRYNPNYVEEVIL
jgi:hypothetical protein